MSPTPPRLNRKVRPGISWPAASLRRSRPETVPLSRPVSRGPRFVRIGIWAALAAGPLALAISLTAPKATVAQAAPAPRSSDTVRPATDPGGVAEMFVELWLRADSAAPDSGAAAAVRALAPQAELPKRPRSETGTPLPAARAVTVRTSSVSGGGWAAVVAVISGRDQSAQAVPGAPAVLPLVRYFAVSGSGGKDGGPVTVSGSPAEVAAPDAVAVSDTESTRPVPSSGALAVSLGEFVRAYLGGQGAGLDRYLSPGLQVSAPKVAPYVRVDVAEVTADTEVAAGASVPADGARARVRVRVIGEDRAGARWPLVYRLEVTARAGRWEVSTLENGITALPTGSASPSAVAGGAR
ncbi:conjugal transfer protein [Streptomyces sp. 4.24]|uniref:conjugal transfer protein n=1 Tax=Streptomyces tritrimontium TaxID=3406573 RepID=UPI003BB780BF